MFFFEKKNQKTFELLVPVFPRHARKMDESLFASFSTEREDSCLAFLPCFRPAPGGAIAARPSRASAAP
jgi:hypothetical protein